MLLREVIEKDNRTSVSLALNLECGSIVSSTEMEVDSPSVCM